MNLEIDTSAFSDAEILAEIAKIKPQLSRRLKSESASGFSATKEDYGNLVAFYNALVQEARLRRLTIPGGADFSTASGLRRRVWHSGASF